MKRTLVVAVVLMMFGVVGVAMAQCPRMEAAEIGPGACPMMDMADAEAVCPMVMDYDYTMEQGPMAQMSGAMEMTAYDGYTYHLTGGTVEKRDAQGNIVASAELPPLTEEAGYMRDQGVCPMCGAMHDTEAARAAGHPAGCRMMGTAGTREQTMAGLRQQQMSRVYGRTGIAADESGVRVMRAGRMYVFDNDLNQQRVVPLVNPDAPGYRNLCECMAGEMEDGTCEVCAIRNRNRGMAIQRPLSEGVLALYHRPEMMQVPGTMHFGVHVFGLERRLDGDARVRGFIYPKGNPDAGLDVTFRRIAPGRFYSEAMLNRAGLWELAVRVMRPGMQDERVYFDIETSAAR